MWKRLLTWLRNPPEEEPVQAHVERLMRDLRNPEPAVRRRADGVVARILGDDAGYGANFRLELLKALAEQDGSEKLDFVPRYVHLLAGTGVPFGRPSPLQLAARVCLNRWQVREDERGQADILLRAADPPANGDTLLRPASGALPTEPELLLRASAPQENG
jgi:hypothetical protein